ncbi:MAG: hypothetical protein MZU95_02285 [Desulfomicrobium escambiense]|nr:hypothetical protein [Desulfomicrobium escambiense]
MLIHHPVLPRRVRSPHPGQEMPGGHLQAAVPLRDRRRDLHGLRRCVSLKCPASRRSPATRRSRTPSTRMRASSAWNLLRRLQVRQRSRSC